METKDKHKRYRKAVTYVSNFAYISGCVVLFLVAIWIIFYIFIRAAIDASHNTYEITELLEDVGVLVFSIAVLDVVRYIMNEEVLRKKEERHPQELKNSLTRFIAIVVTALFLKGLVMTIRVSKEDITLLLYPVALLITPVFLIVGLGIYHRLHVVEPPRRPARKKRISKRSPLE